MYIIGGATNAWCRRTVRPKRRFHDQRALSSHWSQAGAVVFLTLRLHDSIPQEVVRRWNSKKQAWLRRRGIAGHWRQVVPTLDPKLRNAFAREFERTREDFLDTCHGSCALRRPELSQIVAQSLLHFDGERYRMGDFIVMPNHVHLLVASATEERMLSQCDSWMHYTAWRINKVLGQTGKLWQQEPFDHLVRSIAQYDFLRQYIADNPVKARLRPGSYHYRRLESPFAERKATLRARNTAATMGFVVSSDDARE